MRFFSSSALEKAAKFRFAASCSAAEAMLAPIDLRSGLGFRCLGPLGGDCHAAARLLDRRDGGTRGPRDVDGQRALRRLATQQPYAGFGALDQTRRLQRLGVDGLAGIQSARLDRLADAVEGDLG